MAVDAASDVGIAAACTPPPAIGATSVAGAITGAVPGTLAVDAVAIVGAPITVVAGGLASAVTVTADPTVRAGPAITNLTTAANANCCCYHCCC